MKNKLATFVLSAALVIPGIIASTSNSADAKPTKQQAKQVLQILNQVSNSSRTIRVSTASATIGSVSTRSHTYKHTPGGRTGVNISLHEKILISRFLDEANCLVQIDGLNPRTGLPVKTPRLSCAGTNLNNYAQQRYWVDNGCAKVFYSNAYTFDYYQNQVGLQKFLTQIRAVANGSRWL
ncbi:hypothetical protein NIES267_10810 [Calothrix parasitica NIES-267]|uniref:Uncharacterized protein n=1 Tax=Calothrix parasitica NIES-267 TaxID=1973488 RepID=A0A1Z4LK82_9CYAN|nr:hypothetical protein NIES267_10810 [Calothrix parasitica NIES-267]